MQNETPQFLTASGDAGPECLVCALCGLCGVLGFSEFIEGLEGVHIITES